MNRLLSLCILLCGAARAAEPPQWQPVPLPAAARGLLERHENGPYVVSEAEWFTWCPSVIHAPDGKYHMFHSRWSKSIGFSAWLPLSEIVHRVADRPEGPFRFVSVAIPADGPDRGEWFTAHNPKIERFNGRYYLFFVQTRGGLTRAQREELGRAGGKHPRWMEIRNQQRTFVATSKSLNGPWVITKNPIVEPAATIARITVNPAVARRPDGTYLMIVKGDKPGEQRFIRNQAVATAPRPEGPWTIQPKAAIDDLDTEDVSLWYAQPWKRFFAVFHAHTFIGMIESANGMDWRRSAHFELTKRPVAFDEGEPWVPDRMERPFVLTDKHGIPQVLYVACKKGEHSVDLALPLRTRP
ncbi:MAG: glycoside hydrolase family protein [Acidobacteria bacterium]|nr:glycoside hydrolase family protein [Acidobacteriota bacterium]